MESWTSPRHICFSTWLGPRIIDLRKRVTLTVLSTGVVSLRKLGLGCAFQSCFCQHCQLAYKATGCGLYTLLNLASLCKSDEYGFCNKVLEQIGEEGSLWRKYLLSDDATNLHSQLNKQSSDNSTAYCPVSKELLSPNLLQHRRPALPPWPCRGANWC